MPSDRLRSSIEARILADPYDHDAWGAYGQWLTTQGDIRGELVRLDLQRKQGLAGRELRAIEAQIRALHGAHEARWIGELGLDAPWANTVTIEWCCGFVTGLYGVELDLDTAAWLIDLVQHPTGRLLRALDLAWGEDDAAWVRLAATPVPLPLFELRLWGVQLPTLATAGFLPFLQVLMVDSFEVGAAEAADLAAAPFTPRLMELWLDRISLGADGVAALLTPRRFASLRKLVGRQAHLGDDGVAVLAASETLAGLEWLTLDRAGIGNRGAESLARSPHVAALRNLILQDNHITSPGVRALARSPHLAGLRCLALEGNRVGDAGARALAGGSILAGESCLRLARTRVGPKGREALAASEVLRDCLIVGLDAGARAGRASRSAG